MSFNPSKNMVGGFTDNDGTIDFYLRVNSLINKDSIVLDLGAGRASWFEDDNCQTRKSIRLLKGKVKQVIAADVDEAVLSNKASDKQLVIKENEIGIQPNSVDVIIADYVLEHIENPLAFYEQINVCLKSGGWFCARTPHSYSYVALAARLLPESSLKFVQPNRKEIDIFPTRYKMNTLKDINNTFKNWNNKTFIYRTEPSYYFGSKFLFNVQLVLHKIFPAFFCGNLFIFVQKPCISD
jgi:SAM-dependent methyltransferase